MFAQQTETDLPSYRPNILTTSEKLDCFAIARNDGKEVFPRPLQLCRAKQLSIVLRERRVRVRGNNVAIADRASHVRNDETTLVPQYLSALVPSKRAAFTLAEVLITIGIIGVVAAMTMPTLIANYKKKVVATRLKHFASVWQQAYLNVVNENGDELFYGSLLARDPQNALEFYNNTYGKYLKTLKVEKSQYGITGTLLNGSGFHFWRYTTSAYCGGQEGSSNCTYLLFCPYSEDCKEVAQELLLSSESFADGKKYFGFYVNGGPSSYGFDGTREWLMEQCQGNRKGICTKLIEYDGWEIKNDYPIKL